MKFLQTLTLILTLPIQFYRRCISPFTPATCRYTPTCSQYALDALNHHGAFKGCYLATRRICRCHPWGGSGYDPVPGTEEHEKISSEEGGHKSGYKDGHESGHEGGRKGDQECER